MRLIMLVIMMLSLVQGTDKVALVIGNSNYNSKPLPNAVNDARDIASKLTEMNYKVIPVIDGTSGDIDQAISQFHNTVIGAKVAVIFYAGHGIQIAGENYIIPLGVKGIYTRRDLTKLINLSDLIAEAKIANEFGVLFVDACRDNPLQNQIDPTIRSSVSRGLGQVKDTPSNVLVSFATKAGQVANDGSNGRNSPYTTALKMFIGNAEDIRFVIGKVTDKVVALTQHSKIQQEPAIFGSVGGKRYCLTGYCQGANDKELQRLKRELAQLKAQQNLRPNQEELSTQIPSEPIKTTAKKDFEPEMVRISAGSFTMGSNNGDDDEKPPHRVTINYDFEIGKYEVTFEEYDYFCEQTGQKKPNDAGWGRGQRPIINVSWNDAKAYAKWLSQKTGKNYRLPTEAEWEYAARAGTTSKWSFGNSEGSLKNYAWYSNNSDRKTHPVGRKQPNPWGLYDVHGNVWEWCEDWYVDNYNSTPRDGSANTTKDKNIKVLRGGSWINNPDITRSANRDGDYPTYRNYNIGFRLQRTLP